jgi:hypothetical protein
MRESLRKHNINLTTEKDELRKRMVQLEQEKKQFADKLSVEDSLQNITDSQE